MRNKAKVEDAPSVEERLCEHSNISTALTERWLNIEAYSDS